jgi:hypothetical protein
MGLTADSQWYWFHRDTNESTWTQPLEYSSTGWYTAFTAEGTPYYVSSVTGESSWVDPEIDEEEVDEEAVIDASRYLLGFVLFFMF